MQKLKLLIIITVCFNAFGLLFPVLRNDDPILYATIAKHIINSGDWINLTQPVGVDWLDKPHLPFWLAALSFKIFGISSFAYALPGFLFNLLGAYYTYRLGKYLFNNPVGLLSCLIYLSAFHLLLSSTADVRAEAYLMGMIMPACYYWLIYFKQNKSILEPALLFGALFTAAALMTKGLFVLVTIGSGISAVLILDLITFIKNPEANLHNSIICIRHLSIKILLAILISFILITPELVTLYLQFDAHPNKIVFNSMHVSGIKWFFWDSQIGRFFNNGHITRANNASILHYLFFVHTFLWAFLPWSLLFCISVWHSLKNSRSKLSKYSSYYLLASFFTTFVMFSFTRFQLDYYINIVMPFAAILCAKWLYDFNQKSPMAKCWLFDFQIYLAIVFCLASIICSFYIFNGILFVLLTIISVLILWLFLRLGVIATDINRAIIYSVISIDFVFVVIMLIYGHTYANFDAGYKMANYLNLEKKLTPVVDFRLHSLTLEFYTQHRYIPLGNYNDLLKVQRPFYVVAKLTDSKKLQQFLPGMVVCMKVFSGTSIDKVMQNMFNKNGLDNNLTNYVVLKVE